MGSSADRGGYRAPARLRADKGVYAARALADLIERAESDPSITDADIDRACWTDKTWTITEHVLHCRLIEFDEARGIYR